MLAGTLDAARALALLNQAGWTQDRIAGELRVPAHSAGRWAAGHLPPARALTALRRLVDVPWRAAMITTTDSRGYGRTGRLPCGSLRHHKEHAWTGPSTGLVFVCSGHPPTFPERTRLADQRLREENTGITDSWREDL